MTSGRHELLLRMGNNKHSSYLHYIVQFFYGSLDAVGVYNNGSELKNCAIIMFKVDKLHEYIVFKYSFEFVISPIDSKLI